MIEEQPGIVGHLPGKFRSFPLTEQARDSAARLEQLRKAGKKSASRRNHTAIDSTYVEHTLQPTLQPTLNVASEDVDLDSDTDINPKNKPCTSQCDAQERESPFQLEQPTAEPSIEDNNKTPDPRHAPVRATIFNDYKNRFGLAPTWDGSEARLLNQFLKANPTWTTEEIAAMVLHRFQSADINAARPRVWIARLGDYADGSHNQYGRPEGQQAPSPIIARQQRTNERIARIFLGANTEPAGTAMTPEEERTPVFGTSATKERVAPMRAKQLEA